MIVHLHGLPEPDGQDEDGYFQASQTSSLSETARLVFSLSNLPNPPSENLVGGTDPTHRDTTEH